MANKSSIFDVTERIAGNRWFPLIFLPVAFLFVLFYSYTTSPLFVNEGYDSCVFKSMGLAILQGKTPYADLFDHKGPVLYFLNAFGQLLIPGRTGVFCLQVVWMFLTLLFLFKSARMFLRSDLSFAAVLLSLVLLAGTYSEGNQCEEWEMLPASAGFFFALKYLFDQGRRRLGAYSFIWGLCFGFMFFIRPNDAVSQIGAVMCMAGIICLKERRFTALAKSAAVFIVAAVLVAVPVLLWFQSRGAVPDLIYGMITHNTLYSDGAELFLKAHRKLWFVVLFVPMGIMAHYSGRRELLALLIPVAVLSLLLVGGNMFKHYFIIFLPYFLLFWTLLFLQKNAGVIALSLTVVCLCSVGVSGHDILIHSIARETSMKLDMLVRREPDLRRFYDAAGGLVEKIPEDERDEVWNYNLAWCRNPDFSILFHYGIVQCNKVPYFPMYKVNAALKAEDDLGTHRPKWIFVSRDTDEAMTEWDFTPDYDFIRSNYALAGVLDPEVGGVELWRLRE